VHACDDLDTLCTHALSAPEHEFDAGIADHAQHPAQHAAFERQRGAGRAVVRLQNVLQLPIRTRTGIPGL
jgi:hypothetical protein